MDWEGQSQNENTLQNYGADNLPTRNRFGDSLRDARLITCDFGRFIKVVFGGFWQRTPPKIVHQKVSLQAANRRDAARDPANPRAARFLNVAASKAWSRGRACWSVQECVPSSIYRTSPSRCEPPHPPHLTTTLPPQTPHPPTAPPNWPRMRTLLPLLSLAAMARALYFYIDVTSPKCFFEELPKDTLVVGHYKAEEWNDRLNAWEKHDGISIYISVDVRFPFSP